MWLLSERWLIRVGGDPKGQYALPGVVYLQQSSGDLSVWRHCCQIHMRSSRCLVVFSSVLENFVAVVKISSLLEISIADLFRGAWKGGCMIGYALAGCCPQVGRVGRYTQIPMYKPYPIGYPVGDPGRGHFCIARGRGTQCRRPRVTCGTPYIYDPDRVSLPPGALYCERRPGGVVGVKEGYAYPGSSGLCPFDTRAMNNAPLPGCRHP